MVGPAASVTDADGDTRIRVEVTADEDLIRFDTGDNVTGYPAAVDMLVISSEEFTLALPTADVATTVGGSISFTAGTGNTTGPGGGINLLAGNGGATGIGGGLSGGVINITAGSAVANNDDGGDVDDVAQLLAILDEMEAIAEPRFVARDEMSRSRDPFLRRLHAEQDQFRSMEVAVDTMAAEMGISFDD